VQHKLAGLLLAQAVRQHAMPDSYSSLYWLMLPSLLLVSINIVFIYAGAAAAAAGAVQVQHSCHYYYDS
jgi:hypothetical protein